MKKRIYILLGLISLFLISCASNTQKFEINRGTNISHWLSQSSKRGQERVDWFQEKDVKLIADLGFDHIRIPMDEVQLWDESGNKEFEAWQLLNNGLDWCAKYNLKAIVDLHILRSHYFNAGVRPLWTDKKEQDKFVQFWQELSEEMKDRPVDMVAYELMNEAVADNPDDWNNLIKRAYEAIRENEPNRTIVIGSNLWQSPDTFPDLKVPENDFNIILSYHFYTPHFITHYRASWWEGGVYDGPVQYPGLIVEPENLKKKLSDELIESNSWANGVFTKDTLEALMIEPFKKREELNLPLYCGEWGCLHTVPREIRLQWYKDMREILEKNNVAWAIWDYKGAFSIFKDSTFKDGEVDQELVDILLK